jgi:hypothetical protein
MSGPKPLSLYLGLLYDGDAHASPPLELRAAKSLARLWLEQGRRAEAVAKASATAIYDNPGNLIRASDGSRARYVGTQGEVVLEWEPVRGLSFQAAYSLFEPEPFVEQTGPSKTVHFVGTEVQLRF